MPKKTQNNQKLFLFLYLLILLTPFAKANIVGVGQVAGFYIYKINDILVSVSEGDVIDGCLIKTGSGLQCAWQNNRINNDNILRNLTQDLQKLDKLLAENNLLKSKVKNKNQEIKKIKTLTAKKLIQKNQKINKLSHCLNSADCTKF